MDIRLKERLKLQKDNANPLLLHCLDAYTRNKSLKKALIVLTITGAEIFRVRGCIEGSSWSFSLSGRDTQILPSHLQPLTHQN